MKRNGAVNIHDLLAKLDIARSRGVNQWQARCPAHPDDRASLSVAVGDNGKPVLDCHAGCDTHDVIKKLGFEWRDFRSNGNGNGNGHHSNGNGTAPRPRTRTRIYQPPEEAAKAAVRAAGGEFEKLYKYGPNFAIVRIKKPKNFRPIHRAESGWVLGDPPGPLPLYKARRVEDAGTVLVVEGEKDADAGIALVREAGRQGVTFTTSAHGAQSPSKSDWAPTSGKHVYVFCDNDEAGRKYGCEVARLCMAVGAADVRIVDELPGVDKKGDLSDWLAARRNERPARTLRELLRLGREGRQHERATEPPKVNLPEVRLGADEHRVVDEAVAALSHDPELFGRGGALVRIVHLDEAKPVDARVARAAGTPVIRPLSRATLRERLTQHANITRLNDRDGTLIPAHPPGWLVDAVFCREAWEGVRPLAGIVDAPVLRRDGSVHQTPGYDVATGVLFVPRIDGFPALPKTVSEQDAAAAVGVLLDIIRDFPFTEESHKSAWLAALLTPIARSAFNGSTPLFLFDANTPGAGKTLLAQVAGHIATGRRLAVTSYTNNTEELRKAITTVCISGDPVVLFDNVSGRFGNSVLDRMLTCERWKDRLLGHNTEIDLPLTVTWFATANNAQIAGDSLRRIVPIRLEPLTERPEERGGFKYPHLLAHVEAERPKLLAAALTILSGFLRSASQAPELKPFGSFEDWSRVVRGAIVWAGQPDPCEARSELARADTTGDALAALLAAWQRYHKVRRPVSLARLILGIQRSEEADAVMLRAAIEDFCNVPTGKTISAQALGSRLRDVRRRVMQGRYFDSQRRSQNRLIWEVVEKKA